MKSVVLYIAKRYAFSKSKTKAINIITIISAIGIIVSTMTLFVVLSVFNGLENLTKSFANTLDADLIALPKKGKHISLTNEQLNTLENLNGVKNVNEVIEERVIFTFADKQKIAYIKGVGQEYEKNFGLTDYTENQRWLSQNSTEVVVGKMLFYNLGISNSSEEHNLEAIAMKPGEGLFNSPEDAYVRIPLYVTDVYSFSNVEVDNKYIYSDLSTARKLLSFKENQYSKIEIHIDQSSNLTKVTDQIEQLHPNLFQFKNRAQVNESLYKMLKIEKIAVYLVFTLVIIITLFCLCGTIIMIILEKKENLKTLISLGLTTKQLKQIFFYQGMIITVIGTLLGLVLGTIITLLQLNYGLIKIGPNFAYPIAFDFTNIIIVFLTLFTLGLCASFIASSQTNKQFVKK